MAGLLLAGCGLEGESASEPSETDREYATSATVTAEDLKRLGLAPGETFVRSTVLRPCADEGVDEQLCVCALDAVLAEVSASEYTLITLQDGGRGAKVAGDALFEALKACAKGQAPRDLGLAERAAMPAEITPETFRKFFPDAKRAREVATNSCVRDSGASEDVCQCVQDDFAEDFDPFEVVVLSLAAAAAGEVTPYMEGVIEGCGAEL